MNASFLSLATEQFKASAAQAAQTLVTIGANLDEMAASDEYVQSDGYNKTVTHTKKDQTTTTRNTLDPSSQFAPPPPSNQRRKVETKPTAIAAPYLQTQQQRHVVRNVNDDDASTISSHSSAPSMFYKLTERVTTTASVSTPAEQSANVVPLKVHVPNTKFATTKSRRGQPESLFNKQPDNGSSSEEDVEDYDPILAYSRQPRCESKKANRFMNDLETRINTPAQQQQLLPLVPQSHTVSSSPAQEPTSWLSSTFRSVASAGVLSPHATTTNRPPPLARTKRLAAATPEETIVRSNAATLLDETEWRELEQLRSTTTTTKQPSTNTTGSTTRTMALHCPVVQQHRRELFVALTVALAVVVYYLYANSMSIGLL